MPVLVAEIFLQMCPPRINFPWGPKIFFTFKQNRRIEHKTIYIILCIKIQICI